MEQAHTTTTAPVFQNPSQKQLLDQKKRTVPAAAVVQNQMQQSSEPQKSPLDPELWEKYEDSLQRTISEITSLFHHRSKKCGNTVVGVQQEEGGVDDSKSSCNISNSDYTHMPKKGTPLFDYLNSIREALRNGNNCQFDIRSKISNGQRWLPPPMDPLSQQQQGGTAGSAPETPSSEPTNNDNNNNCSVGNCWVYFWLPLDQFPSLCPRNHPCPFCKQTKTKKNGYHFRPMYQWDRTVYVLHRRFLCENPGCRGEQSSSNHHHHQESTKRKTFASIDPRALSELPTVVAERFEFISTTRGYGIHTSMMNSHLFLLNHSVAFGAFAEMVKESRSVDYWKQRLNYYRTVTAPEREKSRKELFRKDKPEFDDRICAWWPHCCCGIQQCNGYNKKRCKVYGINGILPPPQLQCTGGDEQMKRKRRSEQRNLSRKQQKIQERMDQQEQPASLEIVSTSPNNDGTKVVIDEKNLVWIMGSCPLLRLPSISLVTRDVNKLLSSGQLITDNIVQAYLNMLRSSSAFCDTGVRVINTHFLEKLKENSWNDVAKWVREIRGHDTNWSTAPIILVPIFSGARIFGHWSNLLIDRSFADAGSSSLKELMLYADSVCPNSLSDQLQGLLRGTPIDPSSRENVMWSIGNSPEQAPGSMDCTCIKFVAYLKALVNGTLYTYESNRVAPSITFEMRDGGTDLCEWGKKGRRHLLDSLCCGSIDLEDEVICSLKVEVRLLSST